MALYNSQAAGLDQKILNILETNPTFNNDVVRAVHHFPRRHPDRSLLAAQTGEGEDCLTVNIVSYAPIIQMIPLHRF